MSAVHIPYLKLKFSVCSIDEHCQHKGRPCDGCNRPVCALHSSTCNECRGRICQECEGQHPTFCPEAKGDYAGAPGTPEMEARR